MTFIKKVSSIGMDLQNKGNLSEILDKGGQFTIENKLYTVLEITKDLNVIFMRTGNSSGEEELTNINVFQDEYNNGRLKITRLSYFDK